MSSITKDFEKKINAFKNMLYENVILFDQTHKPDDLTPLNNYRGYLLKILKYWSDDLYYNYPNVIKPSFLMPNHQLQQTFIKLTDWYIENILKSNDADLRMDASAIIQRQYEREPLYLK
jgi:hypothetical protein